MTASLVVGGLLVLCTSVGVRAQGAPEIRPVTHIASIAPGSIQGVVQDEHGAPVAGATISALGATTAFAVSDRRDASSSARSRLDRTSSART